MILKLSNKHLFLLRGGHQHEKTVNLGKVLVVVLSNFIAGEITKNADMHLKVNLSESCV